MLHIVLTYMYHVCQMSYMILILCPHICTYKSKYMYAYMQWCIYVTYMHTCIWTI